MVRSRVNRKQTVFVLGAGMSAACGAPLTSDFLTTRFSHYFTAAQLDLINRFASRASLQGEPPTIEDIWVRVDNAILGTPVPGYDQHALRATRNGTRMSQNPTLTAKRSRLAVRYITRASGGAPGPSVRRRGQRGLPVLRHEWRRRWADGGARGAWRAARRSGGGAPP